MKHNQFVLSKSLLIHLSCEPKINKKYRNLFRVFELQNKFEQIAVQCSAMNQGDLFSLWFLEYFSRLNFISLLSIVDKCLYILIFAVRKISFRSCIYSLIQSYRLLVQKKTMQETDDHCCCRCVVLDTGKWLSGHHWWPDILGSRIRLPWRRRGRMYPTVWAGQRRRFNHTGICAANQAANHTTKGIWRHRAYLRRRRLHTWLWWFGRRHRNNHIHHVERNRYVLRLLYLRKLHIATDYIRFLNFILHFTDTTEHISSTIPDTTRHTDGPTTIERETTGTTAGEAGSTTGFGTTTSFGTTPGRTTPFHTSSHTPQWTTTQHFQTTQHDRETTQYHSPSSTTPEMHEHDEDENILDNQFENRHDHEHESDNTHVQYTDLPMPEPEPEPPYYHLPPPAYNPRPKGKNNGRVTPETEERAAMIIGIVAGACIAVVLVIILLIWLRKSGDRTYKTDRIVYGQGPNAALLGSHSNTGTNGSRHQPTNGANVPFNSNGSMRNGSTDKGPQPGLVPKQPKKRDSKDIKEWYV